MCGDIPPRLSVRVANRLGRPAASAAMTGRAPPSPLHCRPPLSLRAARPRRHVSAAVHAGRRSPRPSRRAKEHKLSRKPRPSRAPRRNDGRHHATSPHAQPLPREGPVHEVVRERCPVSRPVAGELEVPVAATATARPDGVSRRETASLMLCAIPTVAWNPPLLAVAAVASASVMSGAPPLSTTPNTATHGGGQAGVPRPTAGR